MRTATIARLAAAVTVAATIAVWPSRATAQHEHHPPAAPPSAPGSAPATAPARAAAPAPADLGPVPPLTDADRAAAFPPGVHGHSVHDDMVHAYVVADELEWRAGRSARMAVGQRRRRAGVGHEGLGGRR